MLKPRASTSSANRVLPLSAPMRARSLQTGRPRLGSFEWFGRRGCLRAPRGVHRAAAVGPGAARELARELQPRQLVADGRAGSESFTGPAIYLEGGGSGAESKAMLRQGMGEFLRELGSRARAKCLSWRIVACGGPDRAFQAFRVSVMRGDAWVSVLLVDAESLLSTAARRHLTKREGWDLHFVSERNVQLMVQAMETWIVADPTAVAAYYGNSFAGNVLPGPGSDLEAMARLKSKDCYLVQQGGRKSASAGRSVTGVRS